MSAEDSDSTGRNEVYGKGSYSGGGGGGGGGGGRGSEDEGSSDSGSDKFGDDELGAFVPASVDQSEYQERDKQSEKSGDVQETLEEAVDQAAIEARDWDEPPNEYAEYEPGQEVVYEDKNGNQKNAEVAFTQDEGVSVDDGNQIVSIEDGSESEIVAVETNLDTGGSPGSGEEVTTADDIKTEADASSVARDEVVGVMTDEFVHRTEETKFYTPGVGTIDDKFTTMSGEPDEFFGRMEELYSNTDVDESAVQTVRNLAADWKANSSTQASSKEYEMIVKEALDVDADVRGEIDGNVDESVVNESTLQVFRDLNEISKEFLRENYAEDGEIEVVRGMNSMTNETSMLESYLENPDADTIKFNGSVVENFAISSDGGQKVADRFTNTFQIKQQVDVDDVALAIDMVPTDTTMTEGEIHIKGDSFEVNTSDITVPTGNNTRHNTRLIRDGGRDIDASLDAVKNPQDADSSSARRFSKLLERWGDEASIADRYKIESDEAAERLKWVVQRGETTGWGTYKTRTAKTHIEEIVAGEIDWDSKASIGNSTSGVAPSAGGTSNGTSGYNFSEFTPADLAESGDLQDFEASRGVTAGNMTVGVIDGYDADSVGDEGLAFITNYGEDAESVSLGKRAMTAAEATAELGGTVPEHVGDPDDLGFVAVEGVSDASEVSAAWRSSEHNVEDVSSDTFYEEAATQVIVDNFDAHPDNVMVDSDGNLHFHDLDHAGGEVAGEYVGEKDWYDNNIDRTLGELNRTAQKLELDEENVRENILTRAEQKANNMSEEEIKSVVENAGNHSEEYAENIRQNIHDLRNGVVRERFEQAK